MITMKAVDDPAQQEHATTSLLAGGCPKDTSSCETSEHCHSNCAGYGKVCPTHARAAGRVVCERVRTILKDSKVFAGGKPPSLRRISPDEIIYGKRLGEGGFSLVDACEWKASDEEEDHQTTKKKKLAIKYLKRCIMVERRTFEYGASDLANEAFFLGVLNHPNIIQLYGVTEGSLEHNIATGRDAGLFIVIDQLVETLDERMKNWKAEMQEMPNGMFYKLSREHKDTQRKLLKERLEVALDVAKVIQYLHSFDIVFRDLKPDNIGFDENGVMKLFDLGLAKELKKADQLEDGTYRMTGHTGSRRYMAPEVAQDRPYGKPVDSYSFAILLWEMCSLEKPFASFSAQRHMRDVVIAGERPKMDAAHVAHWPLDLQWVMKSAWNSDPNQRPSFDKIAEVLTKVLQELDAPKINMRSRAQSVGNHDPSKDSWMVASDRSANSYHASASSTPKSPSRWGRPLLTKVPRLLSRP